MIEYKVKLIRDWTRDAQIKLAETEMPNIYSKILEQADLGKYGIVFTDLNPYSIKLLKKAGFKVKSYVPYERFTLRYYVSWD